MTTSTSKNPAEMSGEELDAAIVESTIPLDADACTRLDALMAERSRRIKLADRSMVTLRAEIERLAIDGIEVEVQWYEPKPVILVDGKCSIHTACTPYGMEVALQKAVAHSRRRVRLTDAGAAMVADELERCAERETYRGLKLSGNVLEGYPFELRDLADGIRACADDSEDLAIAEEQVSHSRHAAGDRFDAMAAFAARARRACRDAVLARLDRCR